MLHVSRQRRMPRCSGAFVTLMVLGLAAVNASAQTVDFRTMAGVSPAGDSDGTGGEARFNAPTSVAVDGAGNIFVADQQNCFIRKVTAAGVVTRFAGTIVGDNPCGSENGAGNVARFSFANGVATDSAGNVYVADTFNNKIRKITPGGIVSTLAGSGGFGFSDGTGAAAQFRSPRGVAVDAAGNVYVADTQNHMIRQVTPAGVVTSVAGLAQTPGSADGTGNAARFNNPYGVAVDSSGNLYVADSNNHKIRNIAAGGVVTTLAGAGTTGYQDGTGAAAIFSGPRGIAVDSAGTLYVADTNNRRIRQVTPAGVVTTFAGSGLAGSFDGPIAAARFNNPEGVTVDAAGVVYVADTTSDTIRKIAGGVVTTLAGFPDSLGFADGTEGAARFAYPFSVAVDSSRNVYVADRNNHTIRKITPGGIVTTLAGLAETSGSADGTGSAARFNNPTAVAVDAAGNVYVADTFNNMIRMITPGGVVTTLAGQLSSGAVDGTGSGARFFFPTGIGVDNATGVVYVVDGLNQTIRKIAPGGVVTTIAGLAGSSGTADGTGSAARFFGPRALAVDAAGVVYITDSFNHTIRKMTSAGVVTTIAGTPGSAGSQDGTGAAARFNNPQGIAVDSAGTLYVADTNNHIIRSITSGNVVTRISGCPGCFGGETWGRFNTPQGIAVDSRGSLYVADTKNNSIRTTAPLGTSLVVDFGPGIGIWLRRGTTWRQVHWFSAKAMLAISDGSRDALIIDFGPGVGIWFYERDGDGQDFWFQIHNLSADAMAGIDSNSDGEVDSGVFSFAGAGLWLFNGDTSEWSQLTPLNPIHLASGNLDGAGGDELIADFAPYGMWVYSAGAWSPLHPFDVSTMITADLDGNGKQDLIVTFPGHGVWAYMNRTTWVPIQQQFDAQRMASADLDGNGVSDLVIDFGPGVGLWARKNGTTWEQLHSFTTENIAGGDLDGDGLDEVIADFGALGVWSYQEGRGWTFVHWFNPKSIVTGRLR